MTPDGAMLWAKFLQAKPIPDQAGPRKWPWILLDSFVKFGAFQWVTTSPKRKGEKKEKKSQRRLGCPRACFDQRAAGARAPRAPPSARRRLGGGLAERVRRGRTRGV